MTTKTSKVKKIRGWAIVYKTGIKMFWCAFEDKIDAQKELQRMVLGNWRITPCTITYSSPTPKRK